MLGEAGPGSGPPGLLGQWCVTLSNVDPRGPVSGLPGSQASGASSNMTQVLDLPIPGPAKTLIGQAPWQSHEHFFSHPLGSGSVAPHLLTLQPSPSPCNLTSLNKEEAPLWWAGGGKGRIGSIAGSGGGQAIREHFLVNHVYPSPDHRWTSGASFKETIFISKFKFSYICLTLARSFVGAGGTHTHVSRLRSFNY